MMREVVSIVVPAFNRAFSIGAALDSLLTQTYENWEALVVDDGSNDRTGEIVKQYSQRDRRIVLIQHDRKRGAQAARNTGLRRGRGRWIAFLDSDDQWLAHSLEARLDAAGTSRVVHSECYVIDAEGERRLFGVPPLRGNVYADLLRNPGPVFPALLISREAWLSIHELDERIVAYQEWDTAIRLARHWSFEFLAEPTFIYDCRHGNTISKNAQTEALGYQQIIDKHRWRMLRHVGAKVLAGHYQQAAFLHHKANEEKRANRCLTAAAICWPFRPGLISAAARRFLKPIVKRSINAHRHFP